MIGTSASASSGTVLPFVFLKKQALFLKKQALVFLKRRVNGIAGSGGRESYASIGRY
jgi:hypothetical protein